MKRGNAKNGVPEPEYQPFFQFAREHCCNYAAVGPAGKRHYCWLEPQETRSACLLPEGKYCRWFVEAVLPLNRDLEAQWHRLQGGTLPWATQERTCACGQVFRARSNRQTRCEDCARAHRRELIREAKRRQRQK